MGICKLFPGKQRNKILNLFLFFFFGVGVGGCLFTFPPHPNPLLCSSFCTLSLNSSSSLTGGFIWLKMDFFIFCAFTNESSCFCPELASLWGFFCFTYWSLILFSSHRNKLTFNSCILHHFNCVGFLFLFSNMCFEPPAFIFK